MSYIVLELLKQLLIEVVKLTIELIKRKYHEKKITKQKEEQRHLQKRRKPTPPDELS